MKPVLAIDVWYKDDEAICIGLIFHWQDDAPIKQYHAVLKNVSPYVPGQFFQRELPCLMAIVEQADPEELSAIVVDGYVQLPEGKKGLGAYLYEEIGQKIPIIGVAKKAYHNNEENVVAVYRGNSQSALYISAIGIEKEAAAEKIRQMHGEYRIPNLLKLLDQLTKGTV